MSVSREFNGSFICNISNYSFLFIFSMLSSFQDQEFYQINSHNAPLEIGEYENCSFTSCDFAEANFVKFKFVSCTFQECNVSMAKLVGTSLNDVQFVDCKMLGLRFEDCNPFGLAFSFDNCQLNHSSFFQLRMTKTNFINCQLIEVDFTESDLTASSFQSCDLSGSIFDRTNLEKADLCTSHGFVIDPENNRLKKAKFSVGGLSGLLTKYDLQLSK